MDWKRLAAEIPVSARMNKISVPTLCKKLGMSTATYYKKLQKPENFTLKEFLTLQELFGWERGKFI